MLALYQAGIPLKTIAWFLHCDSRTVRKWILQATTQGNLQDKERSGRPRLFPEDVRLKTVAFYCQVSPLPGCHSWSLRWAETYLKKHTHILDGSIGRSTIHRILKEQALRPHQNRYFLSITDPDFFPKMDHLIDVYLHPPNYLFNFDECTGLQANSFLCPALPAEPGQPGREEFEYARHGTTDLMAFLNPKTGEIFGRCHSNHNRHTLIEFFKEHVCAQPADVPFHYIMDNLNTHFHTDLCQCIADLCEVPYKPLKTGQERRQWLQSDEKRIVIHFTPFHGSWLNMIEIWFGILSQKCLKHQSFTSISHLQESIMQFIDTWNTAYAHPFTWKYTGEGLHEKAISRFNTLLLLETQQMDIQFLTKQLLLMYNISNTYHKEHTKEWRQFCELLNSKRNYIISIINSDSNEKRIRKAHQALNQLTALMK